MKEFAKSFILATVICFTSLAITGVVIAVFFDPANTVPSR